MTDSSAPWWKTWNGLPRWVDPGRSWTASGPDGLHFVEVRRSGVEPSGGLGVGIPIWLLTRLRWQLFRRNWEVQVLTPWSRGRLLRRSRAVWEREFRTLDEALAAANDAVTILERQGRGGLTE